MKSLLLVVLLLLAGLAAGGWWALGKAEEATRAALPRLQRAAEAHRVTVDRIDFATVRPVWPGLRWSGWTASVRPPPTRRKPQPEPVRVALDSFTVRLAGWSPWRVAVRLEGARIDDALEAEPGGDDLPLADLPLPIERVTDGWIEWPAVAIVGDPRATGEATGRALLDLWRDGRTPVEVWAGVTVHFRLEDRPFTGRLYAERRDGFTGLRLDRGDLARIVAAYSRPITAAEQEIIHEYPLRAPVLLGLQDYATRVAQRLAGIDRAYGEDFTRHVLWSYWLTRQFGAEFAQRVTDAHEEGPTGNTPEERAQDLANNALGRAWAVARKTEGQVLQGIRSDPAVVREPQR